MNKTIVEKLPEVTEIEGDIWEYLKTLNEHDDDVILSVEFKHAEQADDGGTWSTYNVEYIRCIDLDGLDEVEDLGELKAITKQMEELKWL